MGRVMNFFRAVGRALLHKGVKALSGLVRFGEVLYEVCEAVVEEMRQGGSEDDARAAVQEVAQAPPAQIETAAAAVADELAAGQPEPVRRALQMYLTQIPAAIRQSLRRPVDLSGVTVPDSLALGKAEDLLPLLPVRLPRFQPGDRPLPGIDWELEELLGMGGFGEVWKARNPHFDAVPPVALKFCLDPTARDRLLRHEAAVLNQVMRQGRHPGIVQLQHTYLGAESPCLEYEYVGGGHLGRLIADWQRLAPPARCEQATRAVRRLAEIVGFAHRLSPAVVHRDLKPANVLLHRSAGGKFALRVADFGIGGIAAERAAAQTKLGSTSRGDFLMTALRGAHTPLYASPPQMRGDGRFDPRDDVYALGVIWYQMLLGDLTTGRPGGARWQRRLSALGLSPALIDVLAACLEDAAADRPANGEALARALDAVGPKESPPPSAPPPPPPPPEDLAAQVQRTMQRQEQAHARARQLAETEHDYPAAVRELETLPEHLRDAGLHALLVQRRDRAAELDRLVREAVQTTRLKGLRPLVEELLTLHPRADLRRLLATLREPPRRLTNAIGMPLALIPAGSFRMGSPDHEAERGKEEGPVHEVRITRPFYLGVHPVTQAQYERVMGGNPSHFNPGDGGGPEHPVEQVTWDEAVEFCLRLSALPEEQAAGRMYRLPTEAEWEYACRAGTTTPFWWGASASSAQANFNGDNPYGGVKKGPYLRRTTRVGSYPANPWGLCDLHGNVREWCADWFDENYYGNSPIEDPPGRESGAGRVLRGGSWHSVGGYSRAAFRCRYVPGSRYSNIGFRAALTAPRDSL